MRAFVTISKSHQGKPVHNASRLTAAEGLVLPYLSRNGLPAFTFEGDTPYPSTTEFQQIDALPGMIGISYRDEIYVVDANGEAQHLPIRIVSQQEYERLSLHADSHVSDVA